MENGTYAHFSKKDVHGGDAYLHRELGPYSVLDVVLGGVSRDVGSKASNLTIDKLTHGTIESPDHIGDLLREANDELFRESRGESFTTVTAALKIGAVLYVFNVGNNPAYLITGDPEGGEEIIDLATLNIDPHRPARITNAVGKRHNFRYYNSQKMLRPGDKLVLATKGVTVRRIELYDNVIKHASTPDEAVERLQRLLNKKGAMKLGRGGRRFNYGAAAIFRYY